MLRLWLQWGQSPPPGVINRKPMHTGSVHVAAGIAWSSYLLVLVNTKSSIPWISLSHEKFTLHYPTVPPWWTDGTEELISMLLEWHLNVKELKTARVWWLDHSIPYMLWLLHLSMAYALQAAGSRPSALTEKHGFLLLCQL